MKDQCYLVFTKTGVSRLYKSQKPNLKRNEHAVKLTVEVDNSYFRSAYPEVRLEIGPEELIRPEVAMRTTVEGEDGEAEPVHLDPEEYLDQLEDEVRAGDPVTGLARWAYDALVARLEDGDLPWGKRLDHGVRELPGEERATRTVRLVEDDG